MDAIEICFNVSHNEIEITLIKLNEEWIESNKNSKQNYNITIDENENGFKCLYI